MPQNACVFPRQSMAIALHGRRGTGRFEHDTIGGKVKVALTMDLVRSDGGAALPVKKNPAEAGHSRGRKGRSLGATGKRGGRWAAALCLTCDRRLRHAR